MSFASELVGFLRARCGSRPVAISMSTASWPAAMALRQPAEAIAQQMREELFSAFPDTTILMPTFTAGFGPAGLCDLDAEPASTGLINESFRNFPEFRRTRSAFFSFTVAGPHQAELVALRPVYAWGDGSLYSWFHERDIDLVTIGLNPSHSSYLHISEWRMKSAYRYNKQFQGRIRYEGQVEDLAETLYVRCLEPEAINDFARALPALKEFGLEETAICGVRVSHARARAATMAFDSLLYREPYALLKNPGDFMNAE